MSLRTSEERFWSKVDQSGECWEWRGTLSDRGYGRFFFFPRGRKRIQVLAHRYSWERKNGPVPACLSVLHRCDNRKCVRPDHLFLGTVLDNNRDRDEKGRGARGGRNARSKLTASDVLEMRRLHRQGVCFRQLGLRFGVSRPAATDAVVDVTWSHVEAVP